jgi:uncharacterized repeat protein (TIGR01451 family)
MRKSIIVGMVILSAVSASFITTQAKADITTITNIAELYCTDIAGNAMATSTASVQTPVAYLPNVVFTKSVIPAGTQTHGATLTYTLAYENTGSGTAKNVVIVDKIPNGTTYVKGSAIGDNMTIKYCHDGSGNTWDDSDTSPVTHIKWILNKDLAPGDKGSVKFSVTINTP